MAGIRFLPEAMPQVRGAASHIHKNVGRKGIAFPHWAAAEPQSELCTFAGKQPAIRTQDACAPSLTNRAPANGGCNRGTSFHASLSGQQALPDSRVMEVTNRDRERVRGIVRFRDRSQR